MKNVLNFEDFENSEKIKQQICTNFEEWKKKIKPIFLAYDEILKLNSKSEQFYESCSGILKKNVPKMIEKFKNEINSKFGYLVEGKNIFTFGRLVYHIFKNNENILKNLQDIFPDKIKADLIKYYKDYYYSYYSNDKLSNIKKDLALYNYVIKLRDILKSRSKEFEKQNYKVLNPDFFKKYQFDIKSENIEQLTPNIFKNYEKKLQESFKNENNENIIKSKEFIIRGNEFEPVNNHKNLNNDEFDKEFDLIRNNSCQTMTLPEINFNSLSNNFSLNQIYELYKNLKIWAIMFPSYLQCAIINKNKENLEKSYKYFNIMFSIYVSIMKNNEKKKNNSLIYNELNEFINSFKEMIIKLKKEGINMSNINILNSIKEETYQKNPFIIKPKQIKCASKEDEWGDKKRKRQSDEIKEENNVYTINLMNSQNLRLEPPKNIEIRNKRKIKEDRNNSEEDRNNIHSDENEEKEDSEILDDIDIDENINNNENDSVNESSNRQKKYYVNFSSQEKQSKKNISVSSKRFEALNISEDYTLNYIIKKMEEKSQKDLEKFKYEKSSKKTEVKDKSNYKDEYKINPEKLSVINLLENSKFLSSKIYNIVANINNEDYREQKYEILFNKIEANILLDVTKTIKKETRYLNMLLICGLTQALFYLNIPYSLSLIGDGDFQIRIKNTNQAHNNLFLQKLYDVCFIRRNLTQLATSLKCFIDDNENENNSINRVYYIFTNAYDDEIIKYEAWKNKIFNKTKNSFSFIISRNQFNNKNDNKYNLEYNLNYLNGKIDEFAKQCQSSNSRVTVTKISFDDLFYDKEEKNIELLAKNISEVLLREIEPKNKNTSPKLNAIFSIDNSSILTEEYITNFRRLLKNGDLLNKDEFNTLYIKRNKLPNIFDNEKNKQNDFKLLCREKGKILRYDKLSNTIQKNILYFAKQFKEKNGRINLNLMNKIFKPNLATQSTLVQEGTHLDIPALLMSLINKVPNPRIYREIRDGYIKNYAVTIILDTSNSCLNELCIIHALLTLKILLNAISYDNIPCLDIILTTEKEPIILSSEKPANEILKEKSPFWASLCSGLKGNTSSDLASAIKASFNLVRARKNDYTSYLFVLTDGLYSFSERERIIGVTNICYSRNINVFGIGIGICPIGIEKLFPQVIYSKNPYKLIEGISFFFGESIKQKDVKFYSIGCDINLDEIYNNFKYVDEHIKNPLYRNLKDELSNILIFLESSPFYIPELSEEEIKKNPDKGNLYEEGFFSGQKILIAMFFSCELKSQQGKPNSENEKKVKPENITQNKDGGNCIESVLKYYGYEVIVVTNYTEAIQHLCKTDGNDKCYYNSLWVISGQENKDLPTNGGDENDPYYVLQFVDCAIQFWKNGGSLFLMGENDPYNFQLNLFLEKIEFPNGQKAKFKIGGNHEGGKFLYSDDTGELNQKQTFNKKISVKNNLERERPGKNFYQIFEGFTIAYADGEDLEPFIPFCKDSEGGINSLFYNGTYYGNGTGEGDIFIDCGYTKFFFGMIDGTAKYLRNISGFLGSVDRRQNIEHIEHPRLYRPEKVVFNLQKDSNLFYEYPHKIDVVYLVDATGSMSPSIENVKSACVNISDQLKKKDKFSFYEFRFGAVFYRDPVDSQEDKHELFDLNSNVKELKEFITNINAIGGGDQSEDWDGAYKLILNKYNNNNYNDKINWGQGLKLVIHIADAGAHGIEYNDRDNHGKGDLDESIKQCAKNGINISALKIGEYPSNSFKRAQMLYNEELKNLGKDSSNNYFEIKEFNQNISADEFTKYIVDCVSNLKVT